MTRVLDSADRRELAMRRSQAKFLGARKGKLRVAEVLAVRYHRKGWISSVRSVCDCGAEVLHDIRYHLERRQCDACTVRMRVELFSGRPKKLKPCVAETAVLREAGARAPTVWRDDSKGSVEACAELADAVGPMSRAHVAALLGVSVRTVVQIEAEALRKVKAAAGGLRDMASHERPETWAERWDREEAWCDDV